MHVHKNAGAYSSHPFKRVAITLQLGTHAPLKKGGSCHIKEGGIPLLSEGGCSHIFMGLAAILRRLLDRASSLG